MNEQDTIHTSTRTTTPGSSATISWPSARRCLSAVPQAGPDFRAAMERWAGGMPLKGHIESPE